MMCVLSGRKAASASMIYDRKNDDFHSVNLCLMARFVLALRGCLVYVAGVLNAIAAHIMGA